MTNETIESALSCLTELSDVKVCRWTIIGGCMVFLHALRAGREAPRPFHDIDLVVDARAPGRPTKRFAEVLESNGFEVAGVDMHGLAHRFARGGLSIDLLAPDHLGRRSNLSTSERGHTIEAPGGSQALKRTEPLHVEYGAVGYLLPAPNLTGAIVAKAAAVAGPVDIERKHAIDLLFLLSLVPEIDTVRVELNQSDRRRVRSAYRALVAGDRFGDSEQDLLAILGALGEDSSR